MPQPKGPTPTPPNPTDLGGMMKTVLGFDPQKVEAEAKAFEAFARAGLTHISDNTDEILRILKRFEAQIDNPQEATI